MHQPEPAVLGSICARACTCRKGVRGVDPSGMPLGSGQAASMGPAWDGPGLPPRKAATSCSTSKAGASPGMGTDSPAGHWGVKESLHG